MSRQMGIEYPAAVYHANSRGDQREPVFLDDQPSARTLRAPVQRPLSIRRGRSCWRRGVGKVLLPNFTLGGKSINERERTKRSFDPFSAKGSSRRDECSVNRLNEEDERENLAIS